MLVVLGGFLGSGRKLLAREIGQKYSFHYYDIGQKKLRYGVYDANKNFHEKILRPNKDEERKGIYQRAVAEFPMLSKLYTDVVLEDAFHRAEPREYFFEQARIYFGEPVFVWIDSDEKDVLKRLEHMVQQGMIGSVAEGSRRREWAKKNFQPFTDPVLTFRYTQSDPDAQEKLFALVQSIVKHGPNV